MATAAMRNFDFLAFGCETTINSSIVDVGDTRGILVGMRVREFDNSSNSQPAYVNGLLQTEEVQLRENASNPNYQPYALSEVNITIPQNTYCLLYTSDAADE